jgi:glycosyltransferase involved in cell wall biosynthesis
LKIDIALVTKNNVSDISGIEYIPVGQLIVETSRPLGIARANAIKRVNTEWFAFIDDDIEISEDWFRIVTSRIDSDIGAVEGTTKSCGLGTRFDNAINKFAANEHLQRRREITLGQRGFTGNTLIRTSIVKDWHPSFSELSSFEDYEITQHILKKGYRWIVVPTSTIHRFTWRHAARSAMWSMQGWKSCAKPSALQKAKSIVRFAVSPFVMLTRTRDPYLFLYNLYEKLFCIVGILR